VPLDIIKFFYLPTDAQENCSSLVHQLVNKKL